MTCGTTRGGASVDGRAPRPAASPNAALDQIAHLRVLDVAGRRDDQVRRDVGAARNSRAATRGVNDFDRLLGCRESAGRADALPRSAA